MVDGPDLLALVGDQLVALVEIEHAQLFPLGVRHGGAAIIEHGRPRREHRLFPQASAQQLVRRSLDDLEIRDRLLAETRDFRKPSRRRGNHFGERAEFLQQIFGDRLDVAAGQRAEQHQLQQFVLGEALCPRLAEPRPQALAMAMVMRRRCRLRDRGDRRVFLKIWLPSHRSGSGPHGPHQHGGIADFCKSAGHTP